MFIWFKNSLLTTIALCNDAYILSPWNMRFLKFDFLQNFILQLLDGTPLCDTPEEINNFYNIKETKCRMSKWIFLIHR